LAQGTEAAGRPSGGLQGTLDPAEVQDLVFADGRRLDLDGLFNLRDLGGYPAAGGRGVRWRTLLRSDALHRLDGAGGAILAGLGLRTVLDLRTQAETETAPSAIDGIPARRTHISILTGDLQALPLELDAIYRYMIDECSGTIADAIKVLAAPDAFPALVHCSAGKDRTGIVVALILAVLGVPDEVIAADYGLSVSYLDSERTPAIAQLQASTGLGEGLTRPLLSSPPELILQVLARVRAAHGSVEGYLREHGLSSADLDQLRSALLI
jgi:protein-tyrosine phosphatase